MNGTVESVVDDDDDEEEEEEDDDDDDEDEEDDESSSRSTRDESDVDFCFDCRRTSSECFEQ